MALVITFFVIVILLAVRALLDQLHRNGRRNHAVGDTETAPPARPEEDLLSTVSHELRTPLTSIRGALDLVSSGAMGSIPDDIGHLVRIARENSDRLMNLVNDLLDLRKMEAGAAALEIGPVSPADIVGEVVRVMEPIAWAHEVSLDWSGSDGIVHVDRARCAQVLLNLTHNAIRHSPRRGRVVITALTASDKLEFTVDDEGPGVPGSMRDEIFKPFNDATTHCAVEGPSSGLGLSISRRIMMNHGGDISVGRGPSGGARFAVSLPSDCRFRLSATAS